MTEPLPPSRGEPTSSRRDFVAAAVTIAARLLGNAGPQEVVVSGTVKDLVAGSGFSFTDLGERELKGVPSLWRLYAAEPAEED